MNTPEQISSPPDPDRHPLRSQSTASSTTQSPFLPGIPNADGTVEPNWLSNGSIPCLNGLRAVSILIVIVGHIGFRKNTPVSWFAVAADLGVDMFFVISGFLITVLLLRERQRTNTISLKHFYIRRAFRIFPAYAFYLSTLFLLQLLTFTYIPLKAWIAALTYTESISRTGCWETGHTWSLSVEEHFYLVWPLLFLTLGNRRACVAALICVCMVPIVRASIAAWAYFSHSPMPAVSNLTPTRIDSIAIGCCLAFLAGSAAFRARTRLSSLQSTTIVISAVALIALLKLLSVHYESWAPMKFYTVILSGSVRPLLMAVLTWVCITNDMTWFGKILNYGPIAFIGVLSYSLNPRSEHWIHQWPVNVCMVLSAALVSYYMIELPFLRIKERYKS
jgi:peptidoglycan/LPS O-acetylase OafA/YrhL